MKVNLARGWLDEMSNHLQRLIGSISHSGLSLFILLVCSRFNDMSTIHEDVQDYYGHQLQHTNDLKTDACCSKAVIPPSIKEIIRKIHPEVLAK